MLDKQKQPLLIIVTGYPGAGKTTLARALGKELGLPLIHKDGIKETMFDALGWRDREWSRKLGGATYELLYYVTGAMLGGGASLIVESNFDAARASADLERIIHDTGASAIQVVCRAESAVLLERFIARADKEERHPGHNDATGAQEQAERLLQGEYRPLALAGPLLVVDTTDFATVDVDEIANKVRELMVAVPLS